MRRLLLTFAAVALLVGGQVRPAAGYEYMGFFTSSVFADSEIAVCYEGGTPVYTNRGVLAAGMNIWSQQVPAMITQSLGACTSDDVWEVKVLWSDLTFFNANYTCNNTWALTQYVAGSGSQRIIHLNSLCSSIWHWLGPNVADVPSTKISAYSVAAHEFGHAAGLTHDDGSNQDPDGVANATSDLMDDPAAPKGRHCHMSRDDARGISDRYPGLSHGDWNRYPLNKSCFN